MRNKCIGVLLLLPMAGCGGSQEVPDQGTPDLSVGVSDMAANLPDLSTVHLVMSCRSDSGVVADLTVPVGTANRIRVEYGDMTNAPRTTPTLMVVPNSTVKVPLFGMTPGAMNHARVTFFDPSGAENQSDEISVACPALPSDIPPLMIMTASATEGYYLVNVLTKAGAANLIIDRGGHIYYYSAGETAGAFEQTKAGLVTYDGTNHKFVENALTGEVLHTYTDTQASDGADGHEFRLLPNGHVLLLGSNQKSVDTSGVVDGGSSSAKLIENTVVELDSGNDVVFRWTGADHVDLDEAAGDIDLRGPMIDAEHANAADGLSDGNLMVSFRNTDTIYKIDRKSGDVLWRLGGKRSNFTFQNDPMGGFSHQHFAREQADGSIMLFDNHGFRFPMQSRVAQYTLDVEHGTATLIWSHHHTPEVYAYCCGSASRLANGNTLTAWGTSGYIEEVTPSETVVWEVQFPGAVVYRALPISTLYPSGI